MARTTATDLVFQPLGLEHAGTTAGDYVPDRLLVTEGPDRGQSMEFVRDDGGRVNWIRVVGRAAGRTLQATPRYQDDVP